MFNMTREDVRRGGGVPEVGDILESATRPISDGLKSGAKSLGWGLADLYLRRKDQKGNQETAQQVRKPSIIGDASFAPRVQAASKLASDTSEEIMNKVLSPGYDASELLQRAAKYEGYSGVPGVVACNVARQVAKNPDPWMEKLKGVTKDKILNFISNNQGLFEGV